MRLLPPLNPTRVNAETMDAILNALMAIGLLVILVLIIYLIDRVSTIEKETRQVLSSIHQQQTAQPVSMPFLGLSSKKLWDAMTGRPDKDLDPLAIFDLQGPYQIVLSKHVESLYMEGFKDGQRGMSGEPKNTKQITTSAGAVESWIPPAQANAVYQCGLQAAQTTESNWGPVREALDEAGRFLFGKAQLDTSSPLSEWLMPSGTGLAAKGPDSV
jgi:hypothetical protein